MDILKKSWTIILFSFICWQSFAQTSPVNSRTFTNPVIFADLPDVDAIRVDDTFYMVSTTMQLIPGAPIMK